MLELKDFFHLSQVDTLAEQIVAEANGLIVVAGVGTRAPPLASAGQAFLPSGRSTIFRILMRQVLATYPEKKAIVVADDRSAVRIPRQLRRRMHLLPVDIPHTYAECIDDAIRRRPDLLVIDRLDSETAQSALRAARSGLQVLSQLDTIFKGADVARHLQDIGVSQELLHGLRWVIAVDRVPTLCPHCKQPAPPDAQHLKELCRGHPALADVLQAGTFFRALGCADCQNTGRAGDVAVFDIHHADSDGVDAPKGAGLLPLDAYMLRLAALGYLALGDAFRHEADQLRHTYNLLNASERALADANSELQRRLVELEAANQVLQSRTEALISLQGIGQAMIASTGLANLGARMCRHTRDLCGADRAVLYVGRPDGEAEVLAVNGWSPALLGQRVESDLVFATIGRSEPTAFLRWPPGIPPRQPDLEGAELRAGLRVPLVAQGTRVGVMIVHTTRKPRFTPGEVALLQTFANQAAVAIQRAGLIDQLQEKIIELEAAQVELVKKERLDKEMELARQVQQSVLPRVFPQIPGFHFGAHNRPARQVGGDFYDVILLDGDSFGIVVADVSDKGMPAALYMALTRSLLLAEARRERSPRAVLNNVHRLLLELGEPDMFVTVFYGIVEGPERRLTYSRAGHDLPLLLRHGATHTLGGEGIFLGFPDLDELHLSEEHTSLAPGDRLVLYTDGLVDILSPRGHRLGLDRLKSTLQSHAHLPADKMCTATFADLTVYQEDAAQYDDMTMLVVEVI